MSVSSSFITKTWTKAPYLVSTDASQIPTTTLNTWFASKEVYWAKPMPESAMQATLQNSLCFGLYRQTPSPHSNTETKSLTLIGFARCITDTTTFIYLTDVFILPEYQGQGLGKWIVACVQEVIEGMPHLRRSLLFTGDWKRSVPFYEKIMGMEVTECRPAVDGREGTGLAVMMRKWKGVPGFEG
jgi:GNAT superfamily N-acetyltransferase